MVEQGVLVDSESRDRPGPISIEDDSFRCRLQPASNASSDDQASTTTGTPTNIYPPVDRTDNRRHVFHVLMELDDFKKLTMVVNTPNGNTVREYYIDLEKYFRWYVSYQKQFEQRSLVRERGRKQHRSSGGEDGRDVA